MRSEGASLASASECRSHDRRLLTIPSSYSALLASSDSRQRPQEMYETYGDHDSYAIQKVRIEVEIQLEGGEKVVGSVFGTPRQRLSDILNDERGFMPFENTYGILVMLKKSAIVMIMPLVQAKRTPVHNDPYEVLGITT